MQYHYITPNCMPLMYDHIFNNILISRIIKIGFIIKEYQSDLSVPLLNLHVFVSFVEVLQKVFSHNIIEFASRLASEIFRNVWSLDCLIKKCSPVEVLEKFMFSYLLKCCTTPLLWVFDEERINKFSGIFIFQEFWETKVSFFNCSIYSIRISRRIFTKW